MVYGGVEYTYKYKRFCINMLCILLRKLCFVQYVVNTDNCIYLRGVE